MELNLKKYYRLVNAIEVVLKTAYQKGQDNETLAVTDEAERVLELIETLLNKLAGIELGSAR